MIWKKKNAAMQGNDPSAAAANDKTAGKLAGAKAFARKNWKWLVPAAVVVLAGGVFLLKPAGVPTDAAVAIGLLWFLSTILTGLIGGVLFLLDRHPTAMLSPDSGLPKSA